MVGMKKALEAFLSLSSVICKVTVEDHKTGNVVESLANGGFPQAKMMDRLHVN